MTLVLIATLSVMVLCLFALMALIGLLGMDKDPPCETCIGQCNEGRECPNKNA